MLDPYFEAVRARYIERGLERCRKTKLWCAPWVHDTPRHFAACTDDGEQIYAAPDLADLPDQTVLAIFAHEFGHATDFLYPAEFQLGRAGADRRDFSVVSEKQVRAWITGWNQRDADLVEQSADAIAEFVLGMRIGYAGPCQLQCFNRGVARPAGLR